MSTLHVSQLADAELAEAYPLVRSTTGVEMEKWLAFATGLAMLDGGVLGARVREGCLYGIGTFMLVPDLRCGRVLFGDILAAIEMSGRSRTRAALAAGIDRIAAGLGCARMWAPSVCAEHNSLPSLGKLRTIADGSPAPLRTKSGTRSPAQCR